MTKEELERLRKLKKAAVEGIPSSLMKRTDPKYTLYVAPWKQKEQPSVSLPNGDWDTYSSPENMTKSIKPDTLTRIRRRKEEEEARKKKLLELERIEREKQESEKTKSDWAEYMANYRNSDTYKYTGKGLLGKAINAALQKNGLSLGGDFADPVFWGWTLKNAIGNAFNDSSDTHASELSGRIQDKDQTVFEAEEHAKKLQLLKNIQSLEKQRDLAEELYGRGSEQWKQFEDQILKLQIGLLDTDLDKAYKERYVRENMPWYERYITNPIRELTIWGEKEAGQFRDNLLRRYDKESQLNAEDEMLDNFVATANSDAIIKMLSNEENRQKAYGILIALEAAKKNGDKIRYNQIVNNAREQIKNGIYKVNRNEKLNLLAEQNPDRFLDNDFAIPNQLRKSKEFKEDPDKAIRDYKVSIAKQRIKDNTYGKKRASDIYDLVYSDVDSQLEQTEHVIRNAQAEKKELQEDYKRTVAFNDNVNRFFLVAEGYEKLKEDYQSASLLNPMYYVFCMPGTIGSSNSSPEQLVGTAIQYGSVLTGPWGAMVGTLLSAPFLAKGGFDENFAETQEKYLDNLLNNLGQSKFGMTKQGEEDLLKELAQKSRDYWKSQGRSDEWINKHVDISNETGKRNVLQDCMNGLINSTDPRLNKIKVNSMMGLTAMRDADNMRTMGEMPFQLMAQMLPIERPLYSFTNAVFRRSESRILSNALRSEANIAEGRLISNAAEGAAERQAGSLTRNKELGLYENGFRKPVRTYGDAVESGYEAGSSIADAVGGGFGGSVVGGIIGAATKAAGRKAMHLLPEAQRSFVEGVGRKLTYKWNNVYDKLLPQGTAKRVAAKYGFRVGKNTLANSFSEGNEEGVQFLNSRTDFSKYGFGNMLLSEMVANDISQGYRMAEAWGALIGLNNSELKNDAEAWDELWSNVKGGFALGGGHSGLIQFANGTREAYRQYNTDQLLINSNIMNREADKVNRANSKAFAMAAMQNRGRALIESLNDMETRDKNRENPEFTQEDYDFKRKLIELAVGMANNKNIRSLLEAHGLKYGTEEYATAIADQVNIEQNLQYNREQSDEIGQALQEVHNNEFNKLVEQKVNEIENRNPLHKALFEKKEQEEIEKYVKENLGKPEDYESKEEYESRKRDLTRLAEQNISINKRQYVENKTKLVAQLHALLSLKAQHNSVNNWFDLLKNKIGITAKRPDAKLITQSIDEQIKEIQDLLADEFNEKKMKGLGNVELLQYLNEGIDNIVQYANPEEVEQLYKNRAMLEADRRVLLKHSDRLYKGIVNEDGKFVYNPAKWQYQRDSEKQLIDTLQQTGKFRLTVPFEESGYMQTENSKKEKSKYAQRIENIMRADLENERIDKLVADIYAGQFDASDLIDSYTEDEEAASLRVETSGFSSNEVYRGKNNLLKEELVQQTTEPDDTTKKPPRSKEFENRKKAIKRKWKKRLREARKKRRGRSHIDLTFGLAPMFEEVIETLMALAQLTSVNILEFADRIRSHARKNNVLEPTTSLIKLAYLTAKTFVGESGEMEAYDGFVSTPKEIKNFESTSPKVSTVPTKASVTSSAQLMVDKLDKMQSKINTELSTFFDTFVEEDGKMVIYSNRAEFDRYVIEDAPQVSAKEIFDAKYAGQEAFDELLDKHGLGRYKPYRMVEGIENVISRASIQQQNESLLMAKKTKNLIRRALSGEATEEEVKNYLKNLHASVRDQTYLVVDYIRVIRSKIDSGEYTLYTPENNIYGTLTDGQKYSCEADVILIDKGGNIIVNDIICSEYNISFGEDLFERYQYVKLNTLENFDRRQQDVEHEVVAYEILNSIYENEPEIRISVFPIRQSKTSFEVLGAVEIPQSILKNENLWHTFGRNYENSKRVDDLLEELNNKIDEYEHLRQRVLDLGSTKSFPSFNKETKVSNLLNQFIDKEIERLLDKISSINDAYQDAQTEITKLLSISQKDVEKEDSRPQDEDLDAFIERMVNGYEEDRDYFVYIENLKSICESLDFAITQAKLFGNVLSSEIPAFNAICDKVLEAQIFLDEILELDITPSDINSIKQEIELINFAITKLREYAINESLPLETKAKIVGITEWWANDVVTINGENKSFFDYTNKITSFLNGYSEDNTNSTLGLLEYVAKSKNSQLRHFYHDLITRRFAKLLDDALDFANKTERPDQAAVLNGEDGIIKDGYNLVARAMELFKGDDTVVEKPATNEMERINNMPVSRVAEHNGRVTNFHLSRIAQSTNRNYFMWSQYPGFITACLFLLDLNSNGEVVLKITSGKSTIEVPFLEHVTAETQSDYFEKWNKDIQPFLEKIKAMIKHRNANPGTEIVFDLFRNKGKFHFNPEHGSTYKRKRFNLFLDMIKPQDRSYSDEENIKKVEKLLYDVTIASTPGEDAKFGILTKEFVLGERRAVIKGMDSNGNLTLVLGYMDDVYEKDETVLTSGIIIYFYHTNKFELDRNHPNQFLKAPIVTTSIKNPQQLAELLVSFAEGRTVDQNGWDIAGLLDMCLYMYNGQLLTEYNDTSNMFKINSNSREVILGQNRYNRANIDTLVTVLSGMKYQIQRKQINTRFSRSNNKVLQRAAGMFASGRREPITLPNGFVLTNEDFQSGNGTTMLGYLLKNDYLVTPVEYTMYCELNIDNVVLRNKQEFDNISSDNQVVDSSQEANDAIDTAIEELGEIDTLDIDRSGESAVFMTDEQGELQDRSLEEKEEFKTYAESIINKMLGDNLTIVFEDTEQKYLQGLGDANVLGACSTSCITLSKYAPDSTPFHEAFHKIMELLLPDKEREYFYNIYRNRYGAFMTERQVAEKLADDFTNYATRKESIGKEKGWKKVFNFCKFIYKILGIYFKFGWNKGNKILQLYSGSLEGKYKNYQITEARVERFNKMFGENLYYQVKNMDSGASYTFKHISNSTQAREVADAIAYMYLQLSRKDDVLNPYDNIKIDEKTARELLDNNKDLKRFLKTVVKVNGHKVCDQFGEVFKPVVVEEVRKTKDGTKTVKRETFPAFMALSRHIFESISAVATGFDGKYIDMANDQEDDADTYAAHNIDKYVRAAYEFSKLESASKRVRFFFGTVKRTKFVESKNKEGLYNLVLDVDHSPYKLPTYLSVGEVFGRVIKDLGHIRSVEQLHQELRERANKDEMYNIIFKRFDLIYNMQYERDDKGNVTKINYDAESFVTLLFGAIKCQDMNFITCMSETEQSGNKRTRISSSEYIKDIIGFPKTWSDYLLSGMVDIFDRTKDQNGKIRFSQNGYNNLMSIINTLEGILRDIIKNSLTIDGTEYNLDKFEDCLSIRRIVVATLNKAGIMISDDAFDYMLYQLYGDKDKHGLRKLFQSIGSTNSISPFILRLKSFVNKGKLDHKAVATGYMKLGFVSELGNWQGAHNRITSQSQVMGLGGKKFHTMSQNNTLSHTINNLNAAVMDKDNMPIQVRTLLGFGYNIYDNGYGGNGSILLKAAKVSSTVRFEQATYIGFKTDEQGDRGTEYQKEADAEDYIAKMTMLQQGYLISPTMADKGTWMCIGILGDPLVKIPGMTFSSVPVYDDKGNKVLDENNEPKTQLIANDAPRILRYDKEDGTIVRYVRPSDGVLQQMIEYAKCEKLAIQRCMADLSMIEFEGRTPLKDYQKVLNYHTGKVPNGTRFLGLTALSIPKRNKEGRIVDVEIENLNDPNKSSKELLDLADKSFFNKSLDEQMEIMAFVLQRLVDLAVENAIKLGLIERDDAGNLINVHFDENQLTAIKNEIIRIQLTDPKTGEVQDVPQELLNTSAIMALLSDVTTRSQISSEEMERIITGHPAEFKVKYDGGKIKDSTSDKQKRVAGAMSTGEDNRPGMPGIPDEYVCAELKDHLVETSSAIKGEFETLFRNSEVKNAVSNHVSMYDIEEAGFDISDYNTVEEWAFAEDRTLEDILKVLPEDLYENAIRRADKFTSAYFIKSKDDDGINVADGSAFITDTMLENLLRQRGAYNGQVREAFNQLRGKKGTWKLNWESYRMIWEAAEIVTTKYTAYGVRQHNWYNPETGQYEYGDMAVHYYNKYALFPLFEAICTGPMKDVYQKLKDEKVDMLIMTSGVKLGSQGSVKYENDMIAAPFNKYKQRYEFLRRQLNTEPEEEHEIAMGTQMLKVALQNLNLGRKYGNETGRQVRDRLMGHINELAKLGVEKFKSNFYKTEDFKLELDIDKLSAWLKDQMGTRNANRALMEALDVVTETYVDADGLEKTRKRFAAPLSATNDASWIESIIIAKANKLIIDIITPGNSFVQRSVFAMEETRKSGEGSIERADYYNGQELQAINEEGSMDVVISMDYFEDLLPKHGEGMSFNEQRDYLIKNGIIGPNSKAATIGYRIPTQANSSIHAMRFLDVIPGVKSTIILPKDFTKITGSDFDIDHLYLASLNFRETEKGSGILTSEFNGVSEEKMHQNEILSILLMLLKDYENSMSFRFKSIDNDTEPIIKIANKIESADTHQDVPYNYGTLHEQVARRNDYLTGGVGIGPFALNITNNILTYLYGVRFNPNKDVCKNTKIGRLDLTVDDNDISIASWLSGFLNAHVDIVKDPYVSKLNVNPFTFNMINLLLRSGYGESAVWFCAQPVIKAMAEASNKFSSKFTKGGDRLKKDEAIIKAVNDLLGENITMDDIRRALSLKGADSQYINEALTDLDGIGEYETSEGKRKQLVMVYAWFALEPFAKALSRFISVTKIDTRKQGNNFMQMRRYYKLYKEMLREREENEDQSIWDLDTLNFFVKNSWIDYKTEHGINEPMRVLANQSFDANDTFADYVFRLASTVTGNPIDDIDGDTVKQFGQSLSTYIKSVFFNRFAAENGINIKALLTGTGNESNTMSMASSVDIFIYLTKTDERFKRLKNNALLNVLTTSAKPDDMVDAGAKYTSPRFVTISKPLNDSNIDENPIIDAWEDLLNDESKMVRDFAKKLIVYAFVTSGDYRGMNKMFKYVPPSFIQGRVQGSTMSNPGFNTDRQSFSFADYIQYMLDTNFEEVLHPNNSSIFDQIAEQIVGNNYNNFRMIRKVSMKSRDEKGKMKDNFIPINFAIPYGNQKFYNHNSPLFLVGREDEGFLNVDKYIAVRRSGHYKDQNLGTNLYKHVGNISSSTGGVYPIYVLIPKRGYNAKSNGIYEYGRTGYGFGFNTPITAMFGNTFFNNLHNYIEVIKFNAEHPSNQKQLEKLAKYMLDYNNLINVLSYSMLNITLEYLVTIPQQLQQSSNKVTEFQMKFPYGKHKRDDVQSTTTFDAIINGERTSTTRFESQGHINEWKKLQVGDIITFRSADNRKLLVRITKPLTKLSEDTNAEEWSKKEGWSVDWFNKNVKPKINEAWLIEYEYVQPGDTQQLTSDQNTINIYAGTGENAELSNFAIRPFTYSDGNENVTFKSVEQAFQFMKQFYSEDSKENELIAKLILNTTSGKNLRTLGKLFKGFDSTNWDQQSPDIMKQLLLESFKQNPEALQKLLDTGNATLTHTQDKGKWGKEFPRILMEVREELRNQNNLNTYIEYEYINHSGGAIGSDSYWGKIGEQYGVRSNHYYYGEKTPEGNLHISDLDYVEGLQKATVAARLMGRIEPTHLVRDAKLIRNWSQVKYADQIVAVTTMLHPGDEMRYGKKAKIAQGKGGTGYAMQMAINEGKPVYVYDQVRKQWYKYLPEDKKWTKSEVPTLTKNFAGIGTQQLNEDGKRAIREVYEKTFGSTLQQSDQFVLPQESQSRPKYRPVYNFGRQYLTDNDRKYITEHINLSMSGKEYSEKDINNLYRQIISGKLDVESYGEQYTSEQASNDKNFTEIKLSEFEENLIKFTTVEGDDYEDRADKYRLSNRAAKLINYVRSLKNNELQLLSDVLVYYDDYFLSGAEQIVTGKPDLYNVIYDIVEEAKERGDASATAKYSYTDSRQLDLFDETQYQKQKEVKEKVVSMLGGDENAQSEFNDAIKVALQGKTFEESLATVKSIFTDEEKALIKQALNGRKLVVKSASRFTDPMSNDKDDKPYYERCINFLKENAKKPFTDPTRINAMEIWTKHDGMPMQEVLQACKQYKVAPMVSFSITGLGGSAIEPGVMKYQDLLNRIEALINDGYLDPRTTTVRIDPILVGETDMNNIREIVARCKEMGIKKFVTSLVQSYGYLDGTSSDRKVTSGINDALAKEGRTYDWEKYYGLITEEDVKASNKFAREYKAKHPEINWNDPSKTLTNWMTLTHEGSLAGIRMVSKKNIGKIHFVPKQQYIDEVAKVLKELNEDKSISIETCSFHIEGMKSSACLDPMIIERVTGIDVMRSDGTYDVDTSRPDCMCYGVKGDLFSKNDTCFSGCSYCYAAHSDNDPFSYYNEDGTIKDVPLTRVSGRQLGTAVLTPVKQQQEGTFTFSNGLTVNTPFILNEQQEEALHKLDKFITEPQGKDNVFVLSGYAGTGKTSIMKILQELIDSKNYETVYAAISHRANAVTMMNNPNIRAITIHSMLGLSPEFDFASDRYDDKKILFNTEEISKELKDKTVYIIDESSMIPDGIATTLKRIASSMTGSRFIFMGDDALLKPVKQDKISLIFRDGFTDKKANLTKVERTGDNGILNEATRLRNKEDFSYDTLVNSKGEGIVFTNNREHIYNYVASMLSSSEYKENPLHFKILSYLNEDVATFNRHARRALYGDNAPKFIKGEIITAYQNAIKNKNKTWAILNSLDYEIITDPVKTDKEIEVGNHQFVSLSGYSFDIQPVFGDVSITTVFIADTDNKENIRNMKQVLDYINELYNKAKQLYAIAKNKFDRLSANALYAEARRIQQKFFVFQDVYDTVDDNFVAKAKTFDYGYAQTIHKSQGGTYNNVLILGGSLNIAEDPELERQLKYVAVSRAKNMVVYFEPSHKINSTDESQLLALKLAAIARKNECK